MCRSKDNLCCHSAGISYFLSLLGLGLELAWNLANCGQANGPCLALVISLHLQQLFSTSESQPSRTTLSQGSNIRYPARQISTLQFTTVAKLQLRSSNKNDFLVGSHHNMRNVLKGHSIRKVSLRALGIPSKHSANELHSPQTVFYLKKKKWPYWIGGVCVHDYFHV